MPPVLTSLFGVNQWPRRRRSRRLDRRRSSWCWCTPPPNRGIRAGRAVRPGAEPAPDHGLEGYGLSFPKAVVTTCDLTTRLPLSNLYGLLSSEMVVVSCGRLARIGMREAAQSDEVMQRGQTVVEIPAVPVEIATKLTPSELELAIDDQPDARRDRGHTGRATAEEERSDAENGEDDAGDDLGGVRIVLEGRGGRRLVFSIVARLRIGRIDPSRLVPQSPGGAAGGCGLQPITSPLVSNQSFIQVMTTAPLSTSLRKREKGCGSYALCQAVIQNSAKSLGSTAGNGCCVRSRAMTSTGSIGPMPIRSCSLASHSPGHCA